MLKANRILFSVECSFEKKHKITESKHRLTYKIQLMYLRLNKNVKPFMIKITLSSINIMNECKCNFMNIIKLLTNTVKYVKLIVRLN